MKKIYLFALGTTMLAASCGHKQANSPLPVRPVKTAVAGRQSVIRKNFSGVVKAVEQVKLAFRVSGQIVSLPVSEGQRVKKGDLVAAINPYDLSLQYAADKSAYETAAAQLERNRRLLERQAISAQEYETSESSYQRARSAYELSANNLNECKLRTPFDGSIEQRFAENYQRINAGEPVVQLVNTRQLCIKFTVPDAYLYLLRSPDQQYLVEFDTYRSKSFRAKLDEYLDISTNGTGIPVSIVIDDPSFDRAVYDVKPGFTCSISMASDVAPFLKEELVNVPLSAVFSESEGKQTYVWTVKDNRVFRREVEVYSPTGEASLLLSSGLKPGETVVTAGVYQLTEGESVKVLP